MSSQQEQEQKIITEMSQSDLRERRRAKILASKDARMARITNVHNSTDSADSIDSSTSTSPKTHPSIHVEEHILQEYIAESKKNAIQLAKADYELSHLEHEQEPDELLNSPEIKQKLNAQLQSQLSKLHSNSSLSFTINQVLSKFIILISAISAAFFFFQQSTSLNFCFTSSALLNSQEIKKCQTELLPIILQILPVTYAISLLPLLSDLFKRQKSILSILFSIIPTTLLFIVLFLITFRILCLF